MPKVINSTDKARTPTDTDIMVFDFIQANNGATLKEIADFCNRVPQAMYPCLNRLIKQGDIFKGIRKEPNKSYMSNKSKINLYKETICYYIEP